MGHQLKRVQSAGFTLIELMIVVVIVGVLAAVSLPAYQQYALKTHRAKAQSYLMDLASRQEAYYNRFNRYGNFSELDAAGLLADGTRHNHSIMDGRYKITNAIEIDTFAYQMKAASHQLEDKDCLFIRLDQDTLTSGNDTDSMCSSS